MGSSTTDKKIFCCLIATILFKYGKNDGKTVTPAPGYQTVAPLSGYNTEQEIVFKKDKATMLVISNRCKDTVIKIRRQSTDAYL